MANQTADTKIELDLQKRGRISSLQSMGTVDGPGMRYVVFLQGCNLRCSYCHNPETWAPNSGADYTVERLLQKMLRFRGYWGQAGGLTVSGGEPLLQGEFLYHLLLACKERGVHTVVDTSGSITGLWAKRCLALADLVLLDFKFTTEKQYLEQTGGQIQTVLTTLAQLDAWQKPVWLRQVIVPGLNDDVGNINKLKTIAANHACVQKVELLPFRKLCLEKYQNLGLKFPLDATPEASAQTIERLNRLFNV